MTARRRTLPAAALAAVLLAPPALGAGELGMYAWPALHENVLVFVSEGDLWTCTIPPRGADGAEPEILAHRLTSGDGTESMPTISPDGRWLAFAGQYDGNVDVYVMPLAGGAPRRLTFHPAADEPVAWTSDGREIAFRSPRHHPNARRELFTVSLAGGLPASLGIGEGTLASFSGSGRRLAFTPWSNEHWHWKGYRGGTAPDVWVADLESETFVRLTNDPSNELYPMWVGARVFYLSDRDGAMNVWSDAPRGGDARQHTRFRADPANPTAREGHEVRWPSADAARRGSRIAFVQGGDIALLDTADDDVRRLNVRLASDRVAARQRFAALDESIGEYGFVGDGKRIFVASRGEIALVDPDSGRVEQVTRTPGARERGVTALDEHRLLAISDASGEQNLLSIPISSTVSGGMLTDTLEGWIFPPVVAPDGKRIAFADQQLRLSIFDMSTFEVEEVDRAVAGEITDYRFSPDGQWLAWTRPEPNGLTSVHVHSVRTKRSFPVGDGLAADAEPRWDPSGRYLYFLSSRGYDPVLDGFDYDFVVAADVQVYCVPLERAVPPPLRDAAAAVGFDLEAWASGGAKAEPAAIEPGPDVPPGTTALPFDVGDDADLALARRIARLPVPTENLARLEAVTGGLLYLVRPVRGLLSGGDEEEDGAPAGTLFRWTALGDEPERLADGVLDYRVSPDGAKLLLRTAAGLQLRPTAGGEPEPVSLGGAMLRVTPIEEWRQILREAWRLQRDFYFAPNMSDIDWPAMLAKHEALLPRVGTRGELGDLVAEMIGELRTSHAYNWGGDLAPAERARPVPVGLLGADLAVRDRRLVIDRIYRGPADDAEHAGPLAAPHLDVREGDQLLAIDGVPLSLSDNPYERLQGTTGRPVRLTLLRNGSQRVVEVTPIDSEQSLRYWTWVEANRRAVAEATNGAAGYVHIPDMGGPGLSAFVRQFRPQFDKPALVIDDRSNRGGFVSQMILDRLAARPIAFFRPRNALSERYPVRAPHAHMVFLIDEHAGSDGDIFPYMARKLGLGPLVGRRTWGGTVGIRSDKPFVDSGMSTQPEYAMWSEDGWIIENHGVDPDIDVALTPEDRLRGRDPQLARAIEWVRAQLAQDPKRLPAEPAWPRK